MNMNQLPSILFKWCLCRWSKGEDCKKCLKYRNMKDALLKKNDFSDNKGGCD